MSRPESAVPGTQHDGADKHDSGREPEINDHPSCDDQGRGSREKSHPVAPYPRWFGPEKTIESEHAQLRCKGGRPLQITEQTVTILGRWSGILQQVSFLTLCVALSKNRPSL